MSADLPRPWVCPTQLALPLTPEDPALPEPVDVAAVLADMQRLDLDLDQLTDTDDPPQTTAGNTEGDTVTDTDRVMTKAERDELAKLARMRAKLARTEVDQRIAELRADVEAQLSAHYRIDDEAWREVTAAADRAVADADALVAAKCRERGIPEKFRPRLMLNWYGRGENAQKDRQAELRRTAYARIDAEAKAARTAIDTRSLDVQTRLIADGLTSEAARRFLAEMPTPEALMPSFRVDDDPRAIELMGNPRGGQ